MNEETEQVIETSEETVAVDYKKLTLEILSMRCDEKFHKAVYYYVRNVNRILD